ncbi:hypothetical protein LTR12_016703 [Friedmanniomyces endolithicus]|nr:hypothetical protein LTR12_016703 [Friedmanniomyces endolithicus]
MLHGRDHERTRALLGRILVFSVSHNNQLVNLYGHYAVASSSNENTNGTIEELEYFRLTMYEGRDRYKAYNFIRYVYDEFASEHLGRIRDAVSQLPNLAQRTGLSFTSPDLTIDDDDSQQDSEVTVSQDENGFKTHGKPASVSLRYEIRKIREQLQRQQRESKGQMDKLLKQLGE